LNNQTTSIVTQEFTKKNIQEGRTLLGEETNFSEITISQRKSLNVSLNWKAKNQLLEIYTNNQIYTSFSQESFGN